MKFNNFFYITFFVFYIFTSSYSMDASNSSGSNHENHEYDENLEALSEAKKRAITLSSEDIQKAREGGQKVYLTELARLQQGNTDEYVKEAALNSKHKAQIEADMQRDTYEYMLKNGSPALAAQVKAETQMAYQRNKYQPKNIPIIVGGCAAGGVSSGIGSLTQHVTIESGKQVYYWVFPDHEEEFNKKMKLLEHRSLEITPSLEMVKVLKHTLGLLPSEEKELLRCQLDEIEDLILSPEYYEYQSEKIALKKLYKIGELNQRLPLLNSLIEQFANDPKNSFEQQRNLTKLQSFVRNMINDLHEISNDPIEDPKTTIIKTHARDGIIFVVGAAAAIGINYFLTAKAA